MNITGQRSLRGLAVEVLRHFRNWGPERQQRREPIPLGKARAAA